jgi:hypothetical protein
VFFPVIANIRLCDCIFSNICYDGKEHNGKSPSGNLSIKIYTTIHLSVTLYMSDTWSPNLREIIVWGCLRTKCWVAYLDLREREREGVVGGWRKLRNKELCNFYSSQILISGDQIQQNEWAGYVERMGFKTEDINGSDYLVDLGLYWRIILKINLKGNMLWTCGLDSSGSG